MNSIARTIEALPAQQIDPIQTTGDPCLAPLFGVPLTRYQVRIHGNGGLDGGFATTPSRGSRGCLPHLATIERVQSP